MPRAGPWSIFGAAACLSVLAELPAIYATLPFWGTGAVVVFGMAAWLPVCATLVGPNIKGFLERKLGITIVYRHHSDAGQGASSTWWEARGGTRRNRILFNWFVGPLGMLVMIVPILALMVRFAMLVDAAPK